MTAGGVEVAAAVEELCRHLVTGKLVDGAQRDPDAGFLGILAQRDGELQSADLLGDVDQSLGIALDEVEPLLLLTGDGVERGVELGQIDQLLVHHIAHQADTVFRVVVIDVAVDAILVDVLGEQFANDEVDLRTGAVVEESARVGHHAAVDGNGKAFVETVEASQLPDDAEHELASAAGIRLGDGEHSGHVGVEMVVDKHLRGRGGDEGCLHILDSAGRVEVETEHEVGNLEEHGALLGMLVVAHDLLRVRQPLQEVGVLVGYDDDGLFLAHPQIFRPSQTRADGIAIRTLVAGDDDRVGRGNQLLQLTELRFV